MPERTDLPLNCKRRMQAARLLMRAAGNLINTDSFSSINTATAVGDIYAAFEALGMQDYSDDEMTRNYRANTLSAADEIREALLEVEA